PRRSSSCSSFLSPKSVRPGRRDAVLCSILYTIYGAEPAGKAALAGKVLGKGREGWSRLPAGRFGRIPFRRGAETGDFLFWRPEARVIPGSGDKLPLFS